MNGSPGLHAGALADRLQESSGHPFGNEAIEFAGAAVQVTESLNAHGGSGRDNAEGAPVDPVVSIDICGAEIATWNRRDALATIQRRPYDGHVSIDGH